MPVFNMCIQVVPIENRKLRLQRESAKIIKYMKPFELNIVNNIKGSSFILMVI
jgi:hypothetical protein